jgi:hypothetical protein
VSTELILWHYKTGKLCFQHKRHVCSFDHAQFEVVRRSFRLSSHPLSWGVQTASLISLFVLPSDISTLVADTPQYFGVLMSARQIGKTNLFSTTYCLHRRSTCFTSISFPASLRVLLPFLPLLVLCWTLSLNKPEVIFIHSSNHTEHKTALQPTVF